MIQNKKLYVFDLGGVTLDHVDIMAEWVSKIKVDKDEFYKTFREELTPIFLKFQKSGGQAILLNSFYEASITLIPNEIKISQKRKLFK